MASYSITYNSTTVTFNVTGLTAGQKVEFVVRYDPNPGYMLVNESMIATDGSLTKSYNVISPNNYYAVNVAVNDVYLGVQSFNTILGRPENWSWAYAAVDGNILTVNSQVWNSFTARINAFREYKGLSQYTFTIALVAEPFYAFMFNEAITAINAIPGHGTLPSAAVAGVTTLTARLFNQLSLALNAVT